MRFETKSLRSQALGFFLERVNFVISLFFPGFPRIRLTQLVERLFDGELGRFSHCDSPSLRVW